MGQALGDLLSGAAGHTVNRPALDAAVMQGQALAGLRTSQTEEALLNAQKLREEQDAGDQLESTYATLKRADGSPLYTPSQAHQLAVEQRFTHGSFKDAMDAYKTQQEISQSATLADPNADPNARYGADLALHPGANPYQAVGDQLIPRTTATSQTAPPQVFQTPASEAANAEKNAHAGLFTAEATNPQAFHPAPGVLSPGQVQTRAQLIATGQAPMPSAYEWSKNPKLAADTVQAALQANPNITQGMQPQIAATVKDFSGGGKNGQALTGYRTVENHTELLEDAIKALQNHDTQMLNLVMNHAKLQFGDAAPVDANMLPQFLATEGMRALARNGIGGVTDRKELETKLGVMSQGPDVQNEVVSLFRKIINGGKKSLEASYNAGTLGMAGKPGTPTFDEVYAGKPFAGPGNVPSATGTTGPGLPSIADIEAELARRQGAK